MPKYKVYGTVTVEVIITVDADNEDDAFEKAYQEFGGIGSYCGNGGSDKLIGVRGQNESIDCIGEVEWDICTKS